MMKLRLKETGPRPPASKWWLGLYSRSSVKTKELSPQEGTSSCVLLSKVKPRCCAFEFYDCMSYFLLSLPFFTTINKLALKPPPQHISQNSGKIMPQSKIY